MKTANRVDVPVVLIALWSGTKRFVENWRSS